MANIKDPDQTLIRRLSEIFVFEILGDLSAWQTIQMKCNDLFPMKNIKKKKIEECLLQILLGTFKPLW